MYKPKSIYTETAIEAIVAYVFRKETEIRKLPIELAEPAGCFVSVHTQNGALRGCIGTIFPQKLNLFAEIRANAVAAISRDTRFEPVVEADLDGLVFSVDVLSKPITTVVPDAHDPKKYGVIVSHNLYGRGVLLPNLDGIDTAKEQLEIAKRKAGLDGMSNNLLEIQLFRSQRYY